MKVKVKPFKTAVSGTDVTGTIEPGHFAVSFYDILYRIPIVEIGLDTNGQYAVIEETLRRFSDGFELSVEVEPDEDGYHGCIISFLRRDDHALEHLALQQGINPNSVNLVIPPKQLIAVCLDHWGNVDGSIELGQSVILN